MITVQVADSNKQHAIHLAKNFTKEKNVKITDITCSGEETITSYLKNSPDVLILDLNLNNLGGIEVLNCLCNVNPKEKNKCNILIYSKSLNNFTLKYVTKVFRIIEKPCHFDTLINAIKEIYENNSNTSKEPDFKAVCTDYALKLGFNINSKGTTYLIEAINLLCKSKIDIDNYRISDIYKEVSIIHNTTPQIVRWDMEKALSSMYRYANESTIYSLFPQYDGRKPTTKYAITLAVNEIRKCL